MKKAVEIAAKHNTPVALLDRDVGITLKRALQQMSFVEKLKLFWAVFISFFGVGETINAEKVEELKQKDIMTSLMEELSHELPSVSKVLVDERDIFIANKILEIKAEKIVAVVGAGHIEGIKRHLAEKQDISSLLKVEKKKSIFSYFKYIVPLVFIAMLAYGFQTKGLDVTVNVLTYWILINGLLSALGVLIARGHWKSILTAFVAAPLTSLHPALAAGWFAGLMEARVRTPTVEDFETMKELRSYSDLSKNRVSKILLVTALANIGSTLGTLIALPYILTLVA